MSYEEVQARLQRLWDELDSDADRGSDDEDEQDEQDLVEERESSDTEQEFDDNGEPGENDEAENQETADEKEAISGPFFIGKDKITRWMKHAPTRKVKTRRENVVKQLPGVKGVAKCLKSPLDIWSCFFDQEMCEAIVHFTNKKIRAVSERYARERDAYQTNIVEIKALLGLLYLAGIRHANHLNCKDLWKTNGTGIEAFRLTMNQQRFRFLLRNISFDDFETREERRNTDKLALVRFFVEKFNTNSKKYYSHSEFTTVDEKLEAFRGRCGFKQYIPSKPNKYGIKIFALCDSKTFFTSHIEVYVGTQPEGPYQQENSAKAVVERVCRHIYNTGRNITVDNWFTSVPLAKSLQEKGLSLLGTIRKNKRELPSEFVTKGCRPINSSMFGFEKDCTLVSFIPKKNKNVLLLSTMHRDDLIDHESGKPEMIIQYNKTKGGVDTVDKLCAQYNCARNTRRWPMVVFYSLMNMAAINANIIFASNNVDTALSRSEFLEELSRELILDHQKERAASKYIPLSIKVRLQEICKIAQPEPEVLQENQARAGRCFQCDWKKNRKTKYMCRKCNKFLCLSEHCVMVCNHCFENPI